MKFSTSNNESIEIVNINKDNIHILNESKQSELSLLWFKSSPNSINIDTVDYIMDLNEFISLTEFHKTRVTSIENAVLIRWNRAFYCVIDHDSEVGCKGILYYGASSVPVIRPNKEELEILNAVFKMLLMEMQSKDNLQLEMLQMLLKIMLIRCTRIYKNQNVKKLLSDKQIDIIRAYNFLVEQHFKSKHTVKEYADLLYKSPKTLSNIFKKNGDISPLQYIHNRIILEARRQLVYTEQSISDISYALGYKDVQSFSRFFKKQEGISPQKFKEREKLTRT